MAGPCLSLHPSGSSSGGAALAVRVGWLLACVRRGARGARSGFAFGAGPVPGSEGIVKARAREGLASFLGIAASSRLRAESAWCRSTRVRSRALPAVSCSGQGTRLLSAARSLHGGSGLVRAAAWAHERIVGARHLAAACRAKMALRRADLAIRPLEPWFASRSLFDALQAVRARNVAVIQDLFMSEMLGDSLSPVAPRADDANALAAPHETAHSSVALRPMRGLGGASARSPRPV